MHQRARITFLAIGVGLVLAFILCIILRRKSDMPGAPRNIRLQDVGDGTTFYLTWEAPQTVGNMGPLQYYWYIYYTQDCSTDCSACQLQQDNYAAYGGPTTSLSAQLPSSIAQAGAQYCAQVVACPANYCYTQVTSPPGYAMITYPSGPAITNLGFVSGTSLSSSPVITQGMVSPAPNDLSSIASTLSLYPPGANQQPIANINGTCQSASGTGYNFTCSHSVTQPYYVAYPFPNQIAGGGAYQATVMAVDQNNFQGKGSTPSTTIPSVGPNQGPSGVQLVYQ